MRIVCQECDHANELGHVFCVECGGKLDLKNATERIDDANDAEARLAILKIAWIFPVILIVILTALGFWPAKSYYAKAEKKGDGVQVERVMERAYKTTRITGVELGFEFKPVDINEWLVGQSGIMGVKSASIKTGEDKFTFRVVNKTAHRTIGGKVNIPAFTYSYDVTLKPDGGEAIVSYGKIGHLPLLGPAAKLVVSQLQKIADRRLREKTIYESLSEIKVTPDLFACTVKTETAKERHERKQQERETKIEASKAKKAERE